LDESTRFEQQCEEDEEFAALAASQNEDLYLMMMEKDILN